MIINQPMRKRQPLKIRRLRVQAIRDLSPSLRAITFEGDELADFQSDGFDDHVKVFFPNSQGQLILPQVGEEGLVWDAGVVQPAVREYTPTGIDCTHRRLVLEFAMHQAGVATAWAQQAKIGAVVAIAGPRSSRLWPLSQQHYLLLGDETALPAIRRRLRELSAEHRATVIAEINSPADEVALPSAATVRTVWAYRHDAAAASAHFILSQLTQLTLPRDDVAVWIACERAQARALRAWFLEQGYDKTAINAASYWRQGVAAFHEAHPD